MLKSASIVGIVRAFVILPILVLVLVNTLVLQRLLQETTMGGIDRQILASASTISLFSESEPLESVLEIIPHTDSAQKSLPVWSLLRSVQTANELTYAYIFIPNSNGSITYLVDGSPEGEACLPGQVEEIPSENREGIVQVWNHGGTFVSHVLRFDEWGYLKVSAVPILGHKKSPQALVGCDLEISVIRKKIRTVVWISVVLSLVALAIGVWIAIITGRRLLAVIATTRTALIGRMLDQNSQLPESTELPKELLEFNKTWNHMLDCELKEKP